MLFLAQHESLWGSSVAEGSSETLKGKTLIEMMNYASRQDLANIFVTFSS